MEQVQDNPPLAGTGEVRPETETSRALDGAQLTRGEMLWLAASAMHNPKGLRASVYALAEELGIDWVWEALDACAAEEARREAEREAFRQKHEVTNRPKPREITPTQQEGARAALERWKRERRAVEAPAVRSSLSFPEPMKSVRVYMLLQSHRYPIGLGLTAESAIDVAFEDTLRFWETELSFDTFSPHHYDAETGERLPDAPPVDFEATVRKEFEGSILFSVDLPAGPDGLMILHHLTYERSDKPEEVLAAFGGVE